MPLPSLTRRQLLQRFGAAGGASLVMAVLDTWDLRGQSSGPRPVLRGTRPDTRVLVLGGGLSGLVVAHELNRLEYDVRVLEARDEVGGLCWTVRRGSTHTEVDGERQVCDFDEGQYFNAGAWRIPNADRGILDYCRELGVSLELFVNWSDANYFYEEDPEIGPLSGRKVRYREAKSDLWGSTAELLAKAADQGDIDVPLSEADRELLVDFLLRAGYLDSESMVYRPPESRGSEDAYDLSALLRSGFGSRVRSLYYGTGGPDPLFQPVGGMQQIPYAFHRVLGDRVALNAEVVTVRQDEDEVRVVWRDTRTGQETEEAADYCVCCLPMAVLQRLDVDLSEDMAEAVGRTRHSNRAKMGLQMGRRFWEEDEGIYGGHLWARSLQLGEFSYPSNDYFTQKGVLLGYYASGSQNDLDTRPVRERVEHVLTQASKVHPQMREEFESAYAVWWEKVPYSLGAYGNSPDDDLMQRLEEPDRRVYLGSAGVSTRPAWLEGAVQSAWQTVEALHGRVMQEG